MKPPHRSACEHMSTAVLHAHASDGRRSASLPFKTNSSASHRGVLRLCAAASHGHSEQRARIKRLLSRALERCLVGTASTVKHNKHGDQHEQSERREHREQSEHQKQSLVGWA